MVKRLYYITLSALSVSVSHEEIGFNESTALEDHVHKQLPHFKLETDGEEEEMCVSNNASNFCILPTYYFYITV